MQQNAEYVKESCKRPIALERFLFVYHISVKNRLNCYLVYVICLLEGMIVKNCDCGLENPKAIGEGALSSLRSKFFIIRTGHMLVDNLSIFSSLSITYIINCWPFSHTSHMFLWPWSELGKSRPLDCRIRYCDPIGKIHNFFSPKYLKPNVSLILKICK